MPDALLESNPHCLQAHESEVRQCRTDLPFDMELRMDGQDVPDQPYVELKHLDASVQHWGQLKLLLGELDFLTPYLHVPRLTVVYAGSSPGHHLPVLVDAMPPSWTWELYDDKPNEVFAGPYFYERLLKKTVSERHRNCKANAQPGSYLAREQCLLDQKREEERELLGKMEGMTEHLIRQQKNSVWEAEHTALVMREHRPNVCVNQSLLSVHTAMLLRRAYVKRPQTADDPQLLFISDIRTPSATITEELINEDMRVQSSIAKAMRPYQSSLKFRLPYSDHYELEHRYLNGKLLYQPFAPKVSHECRLHVGHGCGKRMYNRVEYNNKMFQYQTVLRTSVYDHGDALPDAERHPHLVSKRVGTDNCFDCNAARQIVSQYAAKAGKPDALAVMNDMVGRLCAVQRACWADGSLEDD